MSKILIVDDDSNVRLLLKSALEELEETGVEVLTAVDGKEALDIIQNNRPNIIFLDIMMPKMNGFDVCSAIKSDGNYRDIFIIILTAKGQITDKEKALECGADMYITKPFDPDEVLEKTAELLKIELEY